MQFSHQITQMMIQIHVMALLSRIPWKTYMIIAFLTVGTMGLSNTSLGYLNYPTQVIFKCCKLIPVMIGGMFIQGEWSWPHTHIFGCVPAKHIHDKSTGKILWHPSQWFLKVQTKNKKKKLGPQTFKAGESLHFTFPVSHLPFEAVTTFQPLVALCLFCLFVFSYLVLVSGRQCPLSLHSPPVSLLSILLSFFLVLRVPCPSVRQVVYFFFFFCLFWSLAFLSGQVDVRTVVLQGSGQGWEWAKRRVETRICSLGSQRGKKVGERDGRMKALGTGAASDVRPLQRQMWESKPAVADLMLRPLVNLQASVHQPGFSRILHHLPTPCCCCCCCVVSFHFHRNRILPFHVAFSPFRLQNLE